MPKKLPKEFICPILQDEMTDPVILKGHSFERSAIVKWLEKNDTHPVTREYCKLDDLQDNRALREAIENFKNEQAKQQEKENKNRQLFINMEKRITELNGRKEVLEREQKEAQYEYKTRELYASAIAVELENLINENEKLKKEKTGIEVNFQPYNRKRNIKKEIDMDKMRQMIPLLDKLIATRGEDTILTIGDVGAGKSTLISYLLGNKLVRDTVTVETKYGCYPKNNAFSIDPSHSPVGTDLPKLGHSTVNAQTLCATSYRNPENKYVYYDFPGFRGDRNENGKELRIIERISMKIAIKKARTRKALIVIDGRTLEVTKGESFKGLIETLIIFFKKLKAFEETTAFVITHMDLGHDYNDHYTTGAKAQVLSKLDEHYSSARKGLESEKRNLEKFLDEKRANASYFKKFINLFMSDNFIDSQQACMRERISDFEVKIKAIGLLMNKDRLFIADYHSDHFKKQLESTIAQINLDIPTEAFEFRNYDSYMRDFESMLLEEVMTAERTIRDYYEKQEKLCDLESTRREHIRSITIKRIHKDVLEQIVSADDLLSRKDASKILEFDIQEKALESEKNKIKNEILQAKAREQQLCSELDEINTDDIHTFTVEDKGEWHLFEPWKGSTYVYDRPGDQIDEVKITKSDRMNINIIENDKGNGKYKVNYTSGIWETWEIELKFSVKRKYLRENARRISTLKKELSRLEEHLQSLLQKEEKITKQQASITNCISDIQDGKQKTKDSLQNKNREIDQSISKLEYEKKNIEKQIDNLNRNICTSCALLQDNWEYYDTLRYYFIHVMEFQDNDSFIQAYNRLKDDSLVNHIDLTISERHVSEYNDRIHNVGQVGNQKCKSEATVIVSDNTTSLKGKEKITVSANDVHSNSASQTTQTTTKSESVNDRPYEFWQSPQRIAVSSPDGASTNDTTIEQAKEESLNELPLEEQANRVIVENINREHYQRGIMASRLSQRLFVVSSPDGASTSDAASSISCEQQSRNSIL